MDQILDVEGKPLAPESIRMLEYLATRAAELSNAAIRERIRAACSITVLKSRSSMRL
jgi:hypothetical protein